jgi:hypothetical protein
MARTKPPNRNTKTKAAAEAAAKSVPRTAFSIPEWCAANDLSEGSYRKLRRLGKGPRETRDPNLRRVLITPEANSEWLAARAAASKTETTETA